MGTAGRQRSDGGLQDDALGLRCVGCISYAQLAAAEETLRESRRENVGRSGLPFVESCCPSCTTRVEEQGVAAGLEEE